MSNLNTNNPLPLPEICQKCPLWIWAMLAKRRLSDLQLASLQEEWELACLAQSDRNWRPPEAA